MAHLDAQVKSRLWFWGFGVLVLGFGFRGFGVRGFRGLGFRVDAFCKITLNSLTIPPSEST